MTDAVTYNGFELEVGENGVTHLRLNRPEQYNSLPVPFFTDIGKAVTELEEQGKTRVLVISGKGKHFCSGIDLSAFKSGDLLDTRDARKRERLYRLVLELQNGLAALEEARFPVIVAVQGLCLGAGLDLATWCDVRLATKDAQFSIEEINIGLMADLGTLQRLPKLLPEGVVRTIAYTGEKLEAERACRLGFVSEVFDSVEELIAGAEAIAEKISKKSPLAIAASKASITYAREHTIADALQHCALLQSAVLDAGDIQESLAARQDKRAAQFKDLVAIK